MTHHKRRLWAIVPRSSSFLRDGAIRVSLARLAMMATMMSGYAGPAQERGRQQVDSV